MTAATEGVEHDSALAIVESLVRLETQIWNDVERSLLDAGTERLATLLALRVIAAQQGTARVQELSEGLGITIGAASKFVDRLERGGLAARRPHPSDRRSSLVELTATGREALDESSAVAESAALRAIAERSGDVATLLGAVRVLPDGADA